jgi:uncharacterized protein YecE (DUF72 family)
MHDPGLEAAASLAQSAGDAAAQPLTVSGQVRVGTASWTDRTLTAAGVFYPRGVSSPEARLRFYSSRFSLVEVDATYYALPLEETAQRWIERTPPGFVFDIKAHALMTGQPSEPRRLPKEISTLLPEGLRSKSQIYANQLPRPVQDAIWAAFRQGIAPLAAADRLGSVLLQYPRWVFPSRETRDGILRARERLAGLQVAVEFRHSSWWNEKNAERTFRFLTDNAIPYVMVDEPQGLPSSVPPVVAVTSPELAVIRFHGRNARNWEQPDLSTAERFRYLYDEDELADWVPRIQTVARSARQTHVLMNNCYANYGTTNAAQLAALLRDSTAH